MKNGKLLLSGFLAGLALSFAPGCVPPTTCSATNCATGCCDNAGKCQIDNSLACGTSGNSCGACAFGQSCASGLCLGNNGGGSGVTTGGGVGSTGGGVGSTGGGVGSTGGGVGSTGGGVGSTGGGVGSTGGGVGSTGGGDGSTGGGVGSTGGGVGSTGGGVGSLGGGVGSTGGGVGSLGGGVGSTGGGVGSLGGGVGSTGGGVGSTGGGVGSLGGGTGATGGGTGTATVGTPCTTTLQCAGLTNGYCKLTTQPQAGFPTSPYPTGFCTVNCTTTCPGTSVCAGGQGSILNWRNETAQFCVPGCSSLGAACANNLECTTVNDLSATTDVLGCWLDFIALNTADAGWVPFTGGGYPTNAGNACTSDAECINPPDYLLGFCATAANGFPGGMCIANSTYTETSEWCTNAGKVENWQDNPDGGNPSFYFCNQGCTAVGNSAGLRPGYSCWDRGDGVPLAWPSGCASAPDCAPYAQAYPQYSWSCNTTSGFCCTSDAGCASSRH